MRHFLLSVVVFGLTIADTLDFSRYAVVVSSIAENPLAAGSNLSSRALSVLANASYDQTWSVEAFLASHPQIRRKLERMTFDSRRSSPRFLSDGMVTVDYEFSLLGGVMRLLLPPTGTGRLLGRAACPCCGQPWPEGREPGPGVKLVPYEDPNAPVWTGILIDVRGLGFKPALFPRVRTENDEEVIGPGFTDEEHLAENGVFGYYRDRDEARLSERIGSDPLVIRAISVTGSNFCDPVISRHDAVRIHSTRANLELLRQCRVGLITD
ncbi:MAG: hypothetical protein ABIK44_01870 [candidate division WOR-3 bacterium]